MERRFDDLKRRFLEMEIRQMKKGEVAARQKLEAAKKSVAEKSEEFERTLKRARRVSDEAWDDVSDTLRGAWIEMKEAVDRAQTEFAGDTAAAEQSEGAG